MTALDRAADLVHDATCRDNQHNDPESEYPCVELAREVLAAGQVEPRTITQVEQLETLPEGTFLRIAGWVYLLHEGRWYLVNTRDMTLGTQSVLGGRIGLNHIGLRHHLPANVLTAQPAISATVSAETVWRIADGLRKRFAVSNGTQVWVEYQGSAEHLADAIKDILDAAAGLTVAGESQ